MSRYRSQRGFTFVELVIVLALFSAIVVGFTSAQVNLGSLASGEMARSALQLKISGALDRVAAEFGPARLEPPSGDGTQVQYQIPVDHDGDGDVQDSAGMITWGMSVDNVPVLGAAATYRFVADVTLDEEELAADVNGDGDRVDRLDLGHLERVLVDRAQRVTGSWILQPTGSYGGDLDGDLLPDPLFRVEDSGRRKLVTLTALAVRATRNGTWLRFPYQFALGLHND